MIISKNEFEKIRGDLREDNTPEQIYVGSTIHTAKSKGTTAYIDDESGAVYTQNPENHDKYDVTTFATELSPEDIKSLLFKPLVATKLEVKFNLDDAKKWSAIAAADSWTETDLKNISDGFSQTTSPDLSSFVYARALNDPNVSFDFKTEAALYWLHVGEGESAYFAGAVDFLDTVRISHAQERLSAAQILTASSDQELVNLGWEWTLAVARMPITSNNKTAVLTAATDLILSRAPTQAAQFRVEQGLMTLRSASGVYPADVLVALDKIQIYFSNTSEINKKLQEILLLIAVSAPGEVAITAARLLDKIVPLSSPRTSVEQVYADILTWLNPTHPAYMEFAQKLYLSQNPAMVDKGLNAILCFVAEGGNTFSVYEAFKWLWTPQMREEDKNLARARLHRIAIDSNDYALVEQVANFLLGESQMFSEADKIVGQQALCRIAKNDPDLGRAYHVVSKLMRFYESYEMRRTGGLALIRILNEWPTEAEMSEDAEKKYPNVSPFKVAQELILTGEPDLKAAGLAYLAKRTKNSPLIDQNLEKQILYDFGTETQRAAVIAQLYAQVMVIVESQNTIISFEIDIFENVIRQRMMHHYSAEICRALTLKYIENGGGILDRNAMMHDFLTELENKMNGQYK